MGFVPREGKREGVRRTERGKNLDFGLHAFIFTYGNGIVCVLRGQHNAAHISRKYMHISRQSPVYSQSGDTFYTRIFC